MMELRTIRQPTVIFKMIVARMRYHGLLQLKDYIQALKRKMFDQEFNRLRQRYPRAGRAFIDRVLRENVVKRGMYRLLMNRLAIVINAINAFQ